jgi:uncharacterized protein (TIGR00369 family)
MDPHREVDLRSRRALETPLLRFLGASLIANGTEPFALSIPLNENALNAVGALHGGVIATVLDVAAYLAVAPHLAPEEEAITIALAASYLAAPPPGGKLRAGGSLLRRTRRLAFLSAELRSEGTLLAVANVTKSIRS